jgi:RNA polymerase sigma-70 factor, ECF subfamily
VSEYPQLDNLVDGIRRRSDPAFADLYNTVGDALASFAFSMLRDQRAAEDAVQQAFLELVKAAPTIKGDGRSLRAWLFRSVRYTCLDEIRRRKRHPETPTESLPETPNVEDEMPGLAMDPDLENALAQLTERQRMLLTLRHVSELSGAEVATAMGMKRPAAYAALARAERRLRSLLTGVESGPAAASQSVTDTEDLA